MEFWDVIRNRRSVRQFLSDRTVTEEQVHRLLEAAIISANAGNRQPWHFYIVRAPVIKEGLAAAAFGQQFVADAPVVVVVCADAARSAERYRERGSGLYCIQDTAIAGTQIMLAAVDMGLGTCWVGAFDEKRAADALQIPKTLRPVAMFPIGYPAKEAGGRTPRRSIEEVTTFME